MNQNNNRNVSTERKATYYIGLVMVIIGFLVFFSIFISVAVGFSEPMMPGEDAGMDSMAIRGVLGMGLMIGGSFMMNVGSRGLAGSGVVLDPQQARRDLEPWSRMAGGMAKDALDEADVRLGGGGEEVPFDEKLRRLEQLRTDGLLSEDEYKAKRAEMLSEKW